MNRLGAITRSVILSLSLYTLKDVITADVCPMNCGTFAGVLLASVGYILHAPWDRGAAYIAMLTPMTYWTHHLKEPIGIPVVATMLGCMYITPDRDLD